ncbi:BGTF surface domain-containing protein [Halorussus sp. MSC15.2]|uniref:BGTF surface domain-containing protein n=1 Tax=Halorussus sp. MSC15.2 TaxID=2283638 RepID=UPI0013D0F351|nr:BGTF surface domain-containing protein [Halorussus sp. MSC15.2]NEU58173.1 hypothetical protein [Halorussus sp. MSC15.2]
MTRTRTSVLLIALLVVSAATAGVTGAAMTSTESTSQAQDPGLDEVPADSGEVFWQGQFLRFTAGDGNASEVWAIRRVQNGQVGGLATEVLLGGNGTAVFATSNLDGRYVVVDENGQPVVIRDGNVVGVGSVGEASFEIAQQSLNATFGDTVVQNDDSPESQTDLRIQSNRAGYGLTLLSEQLSASQLADVFQSVEVRDGSAVVTRNISNEAVLDANFTGVEPGTYNITLVTADGTARVETAITVVEPADGTASLSNRTVTEQRGDVARFNVTFDGTDRATVTIGSRQVGYLSRFTVVDANGDGTATVALDTFRAGIAPNGTGVSVVGEDELTDFQMVTDPIPGRLDAATYPVEVFVGATRSDVGSIRLTERSTQGIQVWTAPDRANVRSVAQLTEVATQNQTVANQDWAIVRVQASGLYSYVQNISDLNNETTGLSMNLTRVSEINQPAQEVPLDEARLIVDESGNQFFLLVDSNTLEPNRTYRANFTISAANPYVSAGNQTSLVANFTVVERDISFDRPIEVPSASGATISGTSTAAPGTELTVEVANTDQNPFLKRQTVTISEDGTWEATFDFSDVPPGTNFTVSTNDPESNATGVVVSGGAAEAQATTTTTTAAEEETTPVGEETTEAAGEGGDETTTETGGATDAETETPAAEGDTTTTTEETTVEASAPAPGFGPVSALAGLVALLAGGAFVARRR